MNIALVIPAFDARLGGAEHWTCQFARLLRAAGHCLHVVAKSFGPEADELEVVRHPLPAISNRFRLAEAAAEVVEGLNVDIVHEMGLGWACDVFQPHGGARRASFEQNLLLMPSWLRPIKRSVAPLLPRYRQFAEIERRQFARRPARMIALSKMVARDLHKYYGLDQQQIRIVYNGVDLKRFTPKLKPQFREATRARLGLKPDDVLVLIVAQNFVLKGVPCLIRAAGRLKAAGTPVKVAVVGGKSQRPYQQMARRHGVADEVLFLGPSADPRPYYAAADIYAQPTFYDPCSLVVLEALACGLPVITSQFNGAGELITPGLEGTILEDPADDATLAAQIADLLDADRRERMGQAAWQLAQQHSLEQNLREMLAVYEECLAERSGSTRHSRAA